MLLAHFFQWGPVPVNQLVGTYDIWLVILSFLVAIFASFVALDIAGRLRDVGNTAWINTFWVVGGGVAMGSGIWSMHFIGMLAFSIPHMMIGYDLLWTVISLLVAIGASCFALLLLKPKKIYLSHLAMGGIILGFAIASMHYVGMHAMECDMNMCYLPSLFILSIIIAIIASEVALWLALKSNQVVASMRFRIKLVSAIVMGFAICGMHYTGMAATIFTPLASRGSMPIQAVLAPQMLSVGIALVTFCILSIAIFVSTVKESRNQQMLAMARQAGMAEVAASVLHNVGNVLNSVNTSAGLLSEKITNSKLNRLEELSQLIKAHGDHLADFLAHDAKGKALLQYIDMLSQQWVNEKNDLLHEAYILLKNINHIKFIIDMQQNLSKASQVMQVVDIEDLIDEVLLITSLANNVKGIVVEKYIKKIKPILIDKIKLLQILVNLINNAKESLVQADKNEKLLKIAVSKNTENRLIIKITDNGMGIPKKNLAGIFAYGFTTKQEGHGFGLHTSALDAKEMGGKLIAESEGVGKGATFMLDLPCQYPEK